MFLTSTVVQGVLLVFFAEDAWFSLDLLKLPARLFDFPAAWSVTHFNCFCLYFYILARDYWYNYGSGSSNCGFGGGSGILYPPVRLLI